MSIQILIADDQGLLRAGLRALLSAEPDMEVVGEAEDSQAVLRLAAELSPQVILLDISMPDCDGIETTRRLKELAPSARVLMITVHEDDTLLQEAIKAGAAGYIVKRAVESELIDAIRAVQRGDIYIHPSMTRALLREITPAPKQTDTPVESLTPRELDILRLIARGCTNRQMADILNLSVRTVEGHRANLMAKLNLQGRVELVRYAHENNLVN